MNGYSNRNYGQRGGGQRGYNNQGNQQRGNQRGNVQGAYRPNSGKLNHNERMRPGQNDPQLSGVCNIELPNGQVETFYVSGWVNPDGTIGLGFKNVNDAQRGGGGNQSYARNQPSQGGFRQGGYQQQGQYGGGGYQPQNRPSNADYQQERYERPQQGGAMSRARDIQPPYQDRGQQQYRDEPPPHDSYPENVVDTDENGQPFDDRIPF